MTSLMSRRLNFGIATRVWYVLFFMLSLSVLNENNHQAGIKRMLINLLMKLIAISGNDDFLFTLHL